MHQALGNKLEVRRDDQFLGTGGNLETTLVSPLADGDDASLKRGFVQVNCNRWAVTVRATVHQRVRSVEQRDAVATSLTGEALIEECCTFDFLGVLEATGQSLGVASREAVVEVVLYSFFGDAETKSNGFVRIP